MNKAVLAVAVLAALGTSSAMAATVYSDDTTELKIGGRAEFRGNFSSGIEGTMENKSRARLNAKGKTKITEDLTGFAKWEAEQSTGSSGDSSEITTEENDTNSSFKQRYMFVGLGTNFGDVSFGKQDTAPVQISGMSDIGTYTGAQKEFIAAGNEQINNTFLYSGEFDALTVQGSFIASEAKSNNGYGISAIYQLPMGLGLGLGYATQDRGENAGKGNQIIGGVNYSMDALYIGATYTQGKQNDTTDVEFTGVEVAAKYKFDGGFSLIGSYQNQKEDKDQDATSDFVEVTGEYKFNKSMKTYAAYKVDNRKNKDNNLRLGLRYDF
ncbi:porin [Vibrio sp. SCSIO 43136]|uniref:porin n=1 Tax=Vibrio sp. SCSIO 43136 TaxID=2819101 RepID=UPI002075A0E3|nr:porin [Vibrio sp. SCSIO 43136]USD66943.1 porin [Vibrio sp. SCSIO 43136]